MIARAFPYDRPCRFQKFEATETIVTTGTTIWKPGFNPAQQGLTSVKFSITNLSDARRAHLWCKEVVRELENYQHVSPEANVSRFSFICYSSETGMLYFNTTQFSAF